MTRRLLLQGLFLSLWSGVAEAVPRLTGRLRAAGGGFARAANKPAPEAPTLSASELATLLAFGEVLVEGRSLSAAEREVVVLRVVLELDGDTTAKVLGIRPTAVSTRLSRALQKLEERMVSDVRG